MAHRVVNGYGRQWSNRDAAMMLDLFKHLGNFRMVSIDGALLVGRTGLAGITETLIATDWRVENCAYDEWRDLIDQLRTKGVIIDAVPQLNKENTDGA